MSFGVELVAVLIAAALVWTGTILLGWALNRRTSKRQGAGPEPFNWRLLINPGWYYEWVSRQ
jgi:hypothetical protein